MQAKKLNLLPFYITEEKEEEYSFIKSLTERNETH